MYTLKIHWWCYADDGNGGGSIVDESTLYLPADEIRVNGTVSGDLSEMKAWNPEDYTNHLAHYRRTDTGENIAGRLIERVLHGESTWYLASKAWLVGPNGKTIERIA